MLRYYAIATAIVLAVAVYATARSTHNFMDFRLAASKRAPLPQHLRIAEGGAGATGDFEGNAPWALSALPDCFIQRSQTTGSAAYVRTRLPAGAQRVAAGTRLSYGPCTIVVGNGDLTVDRGADRLRVPPRARLYRFDHSLALLRISEGGADLRVYDITTYHQ